MSEETVSDALDTSEHTLDADFPFMYNDLRDRENLIPSDMVYFTIFYIHPYRSKQDIFQETKKLYELLSFELKPYVKHYPWNSEPIRFELFQDEELSSGTKQNNDGNPKEKGGNNSLPVREHSSNYSFIYGELNVGTTLTDEHLLATILFKFTSRDPNMYIHTFNQATEFVAADGSDYLPDWCYPEIMCNRIWLNKLNILVIPNGFRTGHSLKLEEAVEYITMNSYKLESLTGILEHYKKAVFDEYPEEALKSIYVAELKVSETMAMVIMCNEDYMCNAAMTEAYKQDIVEKEKIPPGKNGLDRYLPLNNEVVALKIRLNLLNYIELTQPLRKFEASQSDLFASDPLILYGYRLSNAILAYSRLIRKDLILNDYGFCLKETVVAYNKRIEDDELQNELVRCLLINKRVKPHNIDKFIDESKDYAERLTKDDKFDNQKDLLETLERELIDEGNKDRNRKFEFHEDKYGFVLDPDMYNDDSDYDSDSEDVDFKNKFFSGKCDPDIDIDDFYEFFCKEALGLTDEDLETHRSDYFKPPKGTNGGGVDWKQQSVDVSYSESSNNENSESLLGREYSGYESAKAEEKLQARKDMFDNFSNLKEALKNSNMPPEDLAHLMESMGLGKGGC